jgi:hypothetical protein
MGLLADEAAVRESQTEEKKASSIFQKDIMKKNV